MFDDHGLSWAENMRDTREPPEPTEPKLRCHRCTKPIYEGEPYYDIHGVELCAECVFEIYGRYA